MTETDIKILEATERYVEAELSGEGSGHDWWHIVRVRNLAKRFAEQEGADSFICQLAALLHDLADEKIAGSEEAGLAQVTDWLASQGLSEEKRSHILEIIQYMSFKGGANQGKKLTLEGQVVQDADRLDAIGAIGIARVMAYAGNKGNLIHEPGKQVRDHMTVEEYRKGDNTAITHFYEKLLKLKDLMNTEVAKKVAQHRHEFMENYLQEFYAEWDGET